MRVGLHKNANIMIRIFICVTNVCFSVEKIYIVGNVYCWKYIVWKIFVEKYSLKIFVCAKIFVVIKVAKIFNSITKNVVADERVEI